MLALEKKLARRRTMGNLRQLPALHPQPLIDFASNDSLGLARSIELSLGGSGAGSTGSRLLTGNSVAAEQLEAHVSAFHGFPTGVLFGCGYLANLGLLSAIADDNDTLFFDAQIHASMRDGMRLCRARALPFRHNDLWHLEQRLQQRSKCGNRFLCVESIYSTDGSQAPLQELCQLATRYDVQLIVDEAHAVGVHGPQGRGLVAHYGLTEHVFAQVVTFGKALGTYGAMVLGSHCLKDAVINFATPYIYTTALPGHALAAIRESYALFPTMDSERAHLRVLIDHFTSRISTGSQTHIQPIPIAGAVAARQHAQALQTLGFDVRALLSPTVRQGCEILRICLHAFNTKQQVTALINQLRGGLGSIA